ncbi:LAO/AO transport system kinase [Aquimarina sp. EL_43]|uniref:methylmalonyl Co-A mutase-associated GTPase MeaB n=1 Tax=Aquimarina TaxID=290174 RepID=UPI0004711A1C|nr:MULTISPECIES: methylmalonyl Co-A mutase-associated GTPase MeaB [Aquimarina]MBG6132442.1 LAO/AO transport system kinase [Aquimarina sp. EL_35]MBG6152573.1 LAO/AO transport system kinase [Aquimarina sp. EL_32]MBG6170500.1 LAO/AO transport system kinase [Aquimarina sp. EL_43]
MSKDSTKHTSPLSKTPSSTSSQAIDRFKKLQQKEVVIDPIFKAIIAQDTAALSKGITLIESTQQNHIEKAQQLIEMCLPYANNSIRIGITGVPGVGKSTFIEALGNLLLQKGKKVAVLAVDPSSTISHGSILGDKTRMESLVRSSKAFIRPSPSGNSLGGVAQKTRESIILCEAAGYDVIIIETVGVGQSETAVHSMVDFFLLLKLAGAGDELQGIKRGIIEMADALVINKADGDNLTRARKAKNQFRKALHLYPLTQNSWSPEVLTCSAIEGTGIDDIWKMILKYLKITSENGFFEKNRIQQNKFWLLQTIEEQLKNSFYNNPKVKAALDSKIEAVQQHKITPFAAARYLLGLNK